MAPTKHAAVLAMVSLLMVSCGGASTGLSVGDPAPDFALPSASGEQVALGSYRGNKPVLLYFHMAEG